MHLDVKARVVNGIAQWPIYKRLGPDVWGFTGEYITLCPNNSPLMCTLSDRAEIEKLAGLKYCSLRMLEGGPTLGDLAWGLLSPVKS